MSQKERNNFDEWKRGMKEIRGLMPLPNVAVIFSFEDDHHNISFRILPEHSQTNSLIDMEWILIINPPRVALMVSEYRQTGRRSFREGFFRWNFSSDVLQMCKRFASMRFELDEGEKKPQDIL
jgi:hypothetical protein